MRTGAVAIAGAGLVLAGPLAGSAAADEPADDEAVRSFTAAIDVQPDGALLVREEIVYDFGREDHHGLTRAIPVRAPYDSSHDREYPVSDVRVQSPTGAATQVRQDVDDGVLTLRVGDPDREDVTGRQTYVLTYRLAAVVDDAAGRQEVYVDPVGPDSAVPFDRVDVTLTAPGELTDLRCVTGERGGTTPCSATPGAAGTATFTARGLEPEEGVTIAAAMPAGTVAAQPPVLDETFSPARAFRADATSLAATGGVLALGCGAVAVLRRRRTRGTGAVRGSVTWEPTPPEGAPPGVLGALVHGGAQPVDVVATLLDLAQRGHVRLDEVDEVDGGSARDWRITRLAGRDRTSPAEDRLLHTLFRGDAEEARGTTLSQLRTTSRAGVQLTRELLDDEAVRRGWFRARPARARLRWATWAGALLLAGIAAAVLLALSTTHGLVGLALVVVALVALAAGAGLSPLTPAGRDVRERTRAFAATLPGHAGLADADPQRFGRYLPHAVALGATDDWAAGATSLEASGRAVPQPDWYGSNASTFNVALFAGTMGGFSADASSSFVAPPPTSSSSAATFTGGGAGGGSTGSW